MSPEEPRTLLEAEMRSAGLSIRALAKKLAGSADLRQIDNQRTNVKRWLDPDKGVSAESAERLGRVFGRPADYFLRLPQPRPRQSTRLEELAGDVGELFLEDERILSRLQKIETRLGRLEKRLARRPAESTRQAADRK